MHKASITEEEWSNTLKLSTMWNFPEICKLAIEQLSKVAMNPVTKVLLARQYTLQEWLFTGYEELVK